MALTGLTPQQDDVSGWTFARSLPIGAGIHGVATAHRPLPTRSGDTSLRFTLRPGDCSAARHGWNDCARDRERTELKQIGYQTQGETWWYGFSLYVPEEHRNIWPAKLALAQFHQEASTPAVMLQNHKGGLWLDIHDEHGTARLIPIVRSGELPGRWHDIRLHIRWSRNDDGFIEAWLGDRIVARYTGRTMTTGQVYFKFGLYRSHMKRNWLSSTVTHVAYFDNVVRSQDKPGLPD